MTAAVRDPARPGWVTWSGLAVVAGSAAVLSFATVRDLATAASYPTGLSWLLPVVIDTTAVVGSRVWLGGAGRPGAARYARTLALTAASVTIAGNVTEHGLAAYHLAPPWWLIAALAAVPPAALVAVAHLVALLTRERPPDRSDENTAGPVDHHPDREPPHPDQLVQIADPGTNGHRVTDADLLADWADQQPALPVSTTEPEQPQPVADHDPDQGPDHTATDVVLAADLREWVVRGGGPPTRRAVISRYRVGATRAGRLLAALDEPTGPDRARPDPDHARPAPHQPGPDPGHHRDPRTAPIEEVPS